MKGWKLRETAARQRRETAALEREQIRNTRAEHYARVAAGEGVTVDPAPIVVEAVPLEVPTEAVIDEFVPEPADEADAAPTGDELSEDGQEGAEVTGPEPLETAAVPASAASAVTTPRTIFEMADQEIVDLLTAAGVTVDKRWRRARLVSEARTRGLPG